MKYIEVKSYYDFKFVYYFIFYQNKTVPENSLFNCNSF